MPECEACDDTGLVDDFDNDGAFVACPWCVQPEDTDVWGDKPHDPDPLHNHRSTRWHAMTQR